MGTKSGCLPVLVFECFFAYVALQSFLMTGQQDIEVLPCSFLWKK